MDSPLETIHFGISSFGRQSHLGARPRGMLPLYAWDAWEWLGWWREGQPRQEKSDGASNGKITSRDLLRVRTVSATEQGWTRVKMPPPVPDKKKNEWWYVMVPIQNPCLCTERIYIYIHYIHIYVVYQSKPHINLDQFRFRHTKAVFWGRKTCSCFMAWRFPLNIQALWSSIALAYAEFFGNRCASKRWFWHPCWFWNYMKLCIDMISEPWIMNSLKMAHNMSLTRGDVTFFGQR